MTKLFEKVFLLLCICGAASAKANWPERPIRVIVPYATGASGDIVIRLISEELGKRLGQPVIVENRDGAAGNVGTLAAARAAADGYTFLVAPSSNFVINPLIYTSFKLDPLKAFTPVIHMCNTPTLLVTSVKVAPNDLNAFIAYAKANKGKVFFGDPGVGSPVHLALEALNRSQDLGMTSVSYRGSAPVLTDVVSGQIQLALAIPGSAQPHIQSGRIRPVAALASKRLASMPDTPTFADAGLKEIRGETWWAMAAPVGTPEPVLERMNSEVRNALSAPNMRKRLEEVGIVPMAGTRRELADLLSAEAPYWARVVKELAIPRVE